MALDPRWTTITALKIRGNLLEGSSAVDGIGAATEGSEE
jgi:hypothetical protein